MSVKVSQLMPGIPLKIINSSKYHDTFLYYVHRLFMMSTLSINLNNNGRWQQQRNLARTRPSKGYCPIHDFLKDNSRLFECSRGFHEGISENLTQIILVQSNDDAEVWHSSDDETEADKWGMI